MAKNFLPHNGRQDSIAHNCVRPRIIMKRLPTKSEATLLIKKKMMTVQANALAKFKNGETGSTQEVAPPS